jgi:hypothetical protein
MMPDWGEGAPLQAIPLKTLLAYQVFGWLWTCFFLASIQFTYVCMRYAKLYLETCCGRRLVQSWQYTVMYPGT